MLIYVDVDVDIYICIYTDVVCEMCKRRTRPWCPWSRCPTVRCGFICIYIYIYVYIYMYIYIDVDVDVVVDMYTDGDGELDVHVCIYRCGV